MDSNQHAHFFTKFTKHSLGLCLDPKALISTIALTTLATASYFWFANYEPKSLERITEVKGIANSFDSVKFPMPLDAENISNDQSTKIKQATFLTAKSVINLQSFYKSILLDEKWNLESQSDKDEIAVYKYRRNNEYAMIIASKQTRSGKTLAAIKFSER